MSEQKSTGAGKGDKPRPTDKKTWDKNFDAIKWSSRDKKKS